MPQVYRRIWIATIALFVAAGCERPSEEVANATASAVDMGVAVFSFVPLNPKSGTAASDLTKALVQSLEKIPNISVLTRGDLPDAMQEPGDHDHWPESDFVSFVLEGSVKESEEGTMITAQLIDLSSDAHVWAGTYVLEQGDVATILSDVERQLLLAARR
jgi:adenylate cyclase